jgi:hypothetical protein
MFLLVLAIAVLIAAGVMVSVWFAPSVSVREFSRAEVMEAQRSLPNGPTPEQLKQIQEWKKTHPGATTKF